MERTNVRMMRARGRRGVAMLLVLVAMVVAVILTSAAIVSRETSPEMGANATATVAASWSAESAANYAVGVLAEGYDWTAALGADGTFVDSMVVGDATVHVVLTDLEGNVPDSDDRDLYMIATATVGGVETMVRRMVTLGAPGDPIDSIDPMLGEFALFGTEELFVGPSATIGVWPLSPEAATRPEVKLGTSFLQAGDLSVSLDGAMGPVGMFADRNGDPGLISEMESMAASRSFQVPLPIPTLAMGVPSAVMAALPAGGDYQPSNGSIVTMPCANYGQVQIQNSVQATIDGTSPAVIRCDRLIVSDATVRIVGDVSIYVRDRIRVNSNGRIVLADADASLKVYVCNEMDLDTGGQVGVVQSDAGRAASALETWVSPMQVQILEVSAADGGSGATTVTVQGGSMLLGNVHAPGSAVSVMTGGAVIGRATGAAMRVENSGTLLYCPTLDSRVGFTNESGPLYEADGSADPTVEQAIDDALASSGNDAGMFMTLVRNTYDSLVVFTGELEEGVGGTVQQTTNLFSGLTGIF